MSGQIQNFGDVCVWTSDDGCMRCIVDGPRMLLNAVAMSKEYASEFGLQQNSEWWMITLNGMMYIVESEYADPERIADLGCDNGMWQKVSVVSKPL